MPFIPVIERVAEANGNGELLWSSWRNGPLYPQSGELVTGRSVPPDGYGRFLIDIFEELAQQDIVVLR